VIRGKNDVVGLEFAVKLIYAYGGGGRIGREQGTSANSVVAGNRGLISDGVRPRRVAPPSDTGDDSFPSVVDDPGVCPRTRNLGNNLPRVLDDLPPRSATDYLARDIFIISFFLGSCP